ncbi:LruC domain-containing protein [Hufsiella ginkgonis]|uniref:LruC domain-containing protein n=1 Tax=Hufsiella ginkgonis TaxID=2695274 RepID=A0A7K1XS07_9SPHI|nr:LruC domain-containing protein [Hufsiella ginkgonis]MXV13714.1 LruC domain-containing protein [Hufsiella ginkgonis]
MKKTVILGLAFVALLAISSCSRKDDPTPEPPLPERVKAAPDGFDFATSRQVEVNLRLLTTNNSPLKGVLVNFLLPGSAAGDGSVLRAATDANGYIKGSVSVPSYQDTLIIQPNYPGLINNAKALITANVLSASLGGENGYGGNIVPDKLAPSKTGSSGPTVLVADPSTGIDYAYPSPYTTTSSAVKSLSTGVPKYLEATRDYVDQTSLNILAATFPEGSSNNVSVKHPEYLTATGTSVNVTKAGSLYVTFLSEVATYTSSLGYYTYPTANPPTTASDISKVTLVFPNTSANGSQGGLVAGDKVKIGPFTAGTSVGFVLMQDAWTGNSVSVTTQKFFTTPALNPETTTALKRHSLLLHETYTNIYLFGFEDRNRQTASTNPDKISADNDFNDLMFYVSPGDMISSAGIPSLFGESDSDSDGADDSEDEFVNDPLRAYADTTTWNTLAFEDLWPATGDYDMNDLVVQHRYRLIKNFDNNIVEIYGDYKVLAAGASYKDGFGVEFPFAPSLVKTVTGQRRSGANIITQLANGLEAGQTKAVIIPFDDYHSVIPNSSATDPSINTQPSLPKVNGELVSVKVEFNNPISATTLNIAAFNPFLISDQRRGYEVHLPGKTPTDKADKSLLGSGQDRSNSTTGKYYQTANNWPWAINIASTFVHPTETTAIHTVYLHFLDWAQSGGTQYADWYSNVGTGYRNVTGLFTK